MYLNAHTHQTNADHNSIIISNIRVNDEAITLPQGDNIFFSAGIHPWDLKDLRSAWYENLAILLNYKQVLAVGECGLDKNIDTALEFQLEVFTRHIQLSEAHQLPLIIHNVGYSHEILRLHKSLQIKQAWIIHGFRGKPELALQYLQAGFYLSYGEKFNPESVKITPLDKLLIETDESQVPIEDLYHSIAELLGCEVGELLAQKNPLTLRA